MKIRPLGLACPLDRLPLHAQGSALQCASGHSFDTSREGYVNLLTAQHKSSRDPGDTRAMLEARRRILDAGCYAPLADRLFNLIAELHPGHDLRIADAGCGEGYYLDRIATLAMHAEDSATWSMGGMDISKWGLKLAARRTAAIAWAVANNRHPPFAARGIDLILCMFGFPIWPSFAEVTAPGGCVLLVDPGADHLIELRRLIYPEVTRRDPATPDAALACGYRLDQAEDLRFPVRLNSAGQVADLLSMTPHAFRIPFEARARLETISALDVTAHMSLKVLRREG